MDARGGYREGAGRKAGSLNKRTVEVAAKIEALGCPFEGMARIAKEAEGKGDLPTAGRMYAELASYLAPKRKAIEVEEKKQDGLGMTLEELAAVKEAIMSGSYQSVPDIRCCQ